ncbi:MAG: SulP family inorganic anion transporter [Pseudonocardia sp.]
MAGRWAPGLQPAFEAVVRRDGRMLVRDGLAGVTVAAYLVPQVLAYAEVAGLPPVSGLWAAVAATVGYVLLGSSRLVSIGPDATTAVMTAIAVAPLEGGDPGRYAVLSAALALVVAAVCTLGWMTRIGFLADLLSRPVLVGYLSGIALVMVAGQLENLTGVPVEGTGFVAEVVSFAGGITEVHLPTVLLTLAVLAVLVGLPLVAPRLPAPLIAVLLAAAATALLPSLGLAVVGPVPQGLPAPAWPAVGPADLLELLGPAVGVAVVAFSDNVLTGRAFADRHGERVTPDRELLALGAANAASGLLHGFPVTSSGSRTAIADSAGARSQLYSVAAMLTVLAVLWVGGPLLATFPTAALGALVVYAAAWLVDIGELVRFARFRLSELALALVTAAAVLVLGVLYGVLVAVGLSILDLFRRVSRPHAAVLGHVPDLAGMHDLEDYPQARSVPGLVVFRYDAPLFFANADDFRERALAEVTAADPPARWLLLDVEAVVDIDITAADALRALCDELDRRGVVIALARAKQELITALRRARLVDRIERIFPTLPTAVAAYRDWSAGPS